MRNHSFFWPFFLIGAGIVWLMVQLHTIPVENLWALMYIWPFLLIAAGIGLILRSRWPAIRMVVSGLIVLGILLSILFAPQLGWNKPTSWNFINIANINIPGSVLGSGVVISETRQVADFDSIQVNFPIELTIQQGSSSSLKIEGEDNLLPQLATIVNGGTLTIENSQRDSTKRVNPTRPVKITMIVKTLQKISVPTAGTIQIGKLQTNHLQILLSGAGTVSMSDLTAQDLTVNLSGAGSITASGTVQNLSTNISGLGSFQGSELASQTAVVSISGAGSATVWVKSSLSARISGTGSVKYYGSPNVDQQVSGLGSVNSLGNK